MKEIIKEIKNTIKDRKKLGANNCKISYLPILMRDEIIEKLNKQYKITNLYNGSIVIIW